ncbi:MAG: FtsQ-type POTRA domain-containing protein, partial [Mucispirillum sp.]|nr:FtsQ-type POTRA domain-containing protein [Mucispirillum sp.]
MGFKSLFKTLLILCFIGGAAFGIYSLADNIKNSDMFAVSSIEVKGVINADRAALQKLSESFIGVSLFDKRLMDAIESDDPWVQRIVAKRALPDKVNLI